MIVLESCQAMWEFDEHRMRFRRAPKDLVARDADALMPPAEHEWDPYVTLEIDSGSGDFAVVLNGDRTRVLRSHVHRDGCPWCAPEESPLLAATA